MIAIIDYGAGNLFSVKNALDYLGFENEFTSSAEALRKADGMILPGVGAFPDAMDKLHATGLIPVIREEVQKKPLLGICLGMQVLFEKGHEFRECDGLGLIPGEVRLLRTNGLKIPHMGWNSLTVHRPNPLTRDLKDGDYVYFVHSFMADTVTECLTASCQYGEQVTAFVQKGNVYGTQFHPEKSGDVGLGILRNFGRLVQNGGKDSL